MASEWCSWAGTVLVVSGQPAGLRSNASRNNKGVLQ